ncbi:hypothetical protein [Amycolatopsis minnesotensis]|uniref:Secreted protein n=1 Tax=Amycolatopsis minnesotensis TaxID=337894 RepID=A0ABN2R549_9PSEU
MKLPPAIFFSPPVNTGGEKELGSTLHKKTLLKKAVLTAAAATAVCGASAPAVASAAPATPATTVADQASTPAGPGWRMMKRYWSDRELIACENERYAKYQGDPAVVRSECRSVTPGWELWVLFGG